MKTPLQHGSWRSQAFLDSGQVLWLQMRADDQACIIGRTVEKLCKTRSEVSESAAAEVPEHALQRSCASQAGDQNLAD